MNVAGYTETYSEKAFWEKVLNCLKAAGWQVIEKALLLYFAAQKAETPAWAKGTIFASLGYFICPIDAIPDITPFIGYADDLGVLTLAVASVSMYIDEDVKAKTTLKMNQWFGA